jgi:hypothetical protein
MICVDSLQTIQPKSKSVSRFGNRWCHLFSDDGNIEELHQMALKIGLNKSYFQNHAFLPHYDLIPSKRELALKKGAIEKESTSTVCEAMLRAKRNRQIV